MVVLEVRNLKSVPADRIIYCTMEVDNCDKLATDQVEASKPYWDTQVRMLMIVVMMIIMGHHDHDHNDDGG